MTKIIKKCLLGIVSITLITGCITETKKLIVFENQIKNNNEFDKKYLGVYKIGDTGPLTVLYKKDEKYRVMRLENNNFFDEAVTISKPNTKKECYLFSFPKIIYYEYNGYKTPPSEYNGYKTSAFNAAILLRHTPYDIEYNYEVVKNARQKTEEEIKKEFTNECDSVDTIDWVQVSQVPQDELDKYIANIIDEKPYAAKVIPPRFIKDNPYIMTSYKKILKIVSENGALLNFLPEKYKKDKDIVLAAVNKDGKALKYADNSLRKDKDVVLAAVYQDGGALKYADNSLKKDKEIITASNKNKQEAIKYFGNELKKLFEKYKSQKTTDYLLEDFFGNLIHVDNTPEGFIFHEFRNKVIILVMSRYPDGCTPCPKFKRSLAKVQKKYSKNLRVVSIDVSHKDKSTILKTIIKLGINYPIIIENPKYDSAMLEDTINKRAQVNGYTPFVLALDTKGVVQFGRAGVLSKDDLEKLIKRLFKN